MEPATRAFTTLHEVRFDPLAGQRVLDNLPAIEESQASHKKLITEAFPVVAYLLYVLVGGWLVLERNGTRSEANRREAKRKGMMCGIGARHDNA